MTQRCEDIMNHNSLTEKELQQELQEFKERYPKLSMDELFVLWFLRAFLTENEDQAARALCGGPCDKGIDAVLVDDDTRNVFIIQAKYRLEVGKKNENRPDVLGFAGIALTLTGSIGVFSDYLNDLSPEVGKRLEDARRRIVSRGYKLQM